jgi:hypothetical protein
LLPLALSCLGVRHNPDEAFELLTISSDNAAADAPLYSSQRRHDGGGGSAVLRHGENALSKSQQSRRISRQLEQDLHCIRNSTIRRYILRLIVSHASAHRRQLILSGRKQRPRLTGRPLTVSFSGVACRPARISIGTPWKQYHLMNTANSNSGYRALVTDLRQERADRRSEAARR